MILDIISKYINFREPNFEKALAYSFLCFLLWVLLPHLEFKYKLLSRLIGHNQGRALDFLAYFLIYVGTIRNHAFNEAVNHNIKISYGMFEIPIQIMCFAAMAFGLTLIAFSFYRLGMTNMYFGDHFGFLFKEKITTFPYNYFENPQYVGTTWFFMGFSICFHSPTGLFLTFVVYILYMILNVVEARKLKVFYPDSPIKEAKAN